MAFSLGGSMAGISGTMMGWVTTTAFWILLMLVIVIFLILFLWIRKKRRMNKTVLELYDLGDGRFDFITTKGGWFKNRFTLFGLWDYGSENRFRLKDMTPVDNVSHNDYRLFNGKPAIVVIRNPHDAKMLYPISRFYLSNNSKTIMSEVAPADYRDSAEKAIEQADIEMRNKWQQYAPLIVGGLVIIISLIITLLNTQYGKYMVDKSTETLLQIKQMTCSGVASSTAP
jgi:hypothetical protein